MVRTMGTHKRETRNPKPFQSHPAKSSRDRGKEKKMGNAFMILGVGFRASTRNAPMPPPASACTKSPQNEFTRWLFFRGVVIVAQGSELSKPWNGWSGLDALEAVLDV